MLAFHFLIGKLVGIDFQKSDHWVLRDGRKTAGSCLKTIDTDEYYESFYNYALFFTTEKL